MYVVINGGGNVGSYLANAFSGKGHDVAVIEKRPDVIEKLADELPTNVLLIEGDGCDVRFQEDAGVGHADVLASVTRNDDDNLVSCQLAKVHFNIKRAVARVNNPRNEQVFQALGIEAVSSTSIISRLIEEEMALGDVFRLIPLQKGGLTLIELNIEADGSPCCLQPIASLGLSSDTVLVTITRGDKILIPRGDTRLEPGDRIIALTKVGGEEELSRVLLSPRARNKE